MRLLFLATGLLGSGCAARWTPDEDESAGTRPPQVYLTSPSLGTTWETTLGIPLTAVVADDVDAADALTVEVRSNIDGVVAAPLVESDGEIDVVLTLSPGTHTLTLSAVDSDGMEGADTTTVRVLDPGAPSQPAVRVDPVEPVTGESLYASIVVPAVDPEGDPLSYEWSWSVDGVDAGITTPEVSGLLVRDGQTWTVSMRATDGVTQSAVTTRSVVVGNAPPDGGTVAILPLTLSVGDLATCAHAPVEDPEGDAFTTSYRWYVDDVATLSTDATFDTSGLRRGARLACALAVNDGVPTEHRSADVVVGNTPPILGAATISPSIATAADTLRCVPSGVVDADLDPVTLTYAWEVNGVEVATSGTLTAPSFGRGDAVRCAVLPSDPQGAGARVYSLGAEVRNSAPSAPVAAFVQTDVLPGTDAVCEVVTAATDVDGDAISYRWSWEVDGASVAGSASRFDTSDLDVGQTLSCIAISDDGFDVGASARADIVLTGPVSGDIGVSDAFAVLTGTVASGAFGKALDRVEDLDGDGLDELIVSAPRGDGSTKGAAFLYLGSTLADGGAFTDTDADYIFYGRASNDFLGAGRGVAGVGDLDGDGNGDLVLAAPFEDTGGSEAGIAYVLYGASPWTSGTDALSIADARVYGEAGDWLGTRIAGGDLDGDGLAELVVSAPYNDLGGDKAGAFAVYGGDASRLSGGLSLSAADAIITGAEAQTELGWSLDVMGDVNGDGYADVGVGVFLDDTHATDAGTAAIISGAELTSGQATYESCAFLVVRGTSATGRLGYDVSGVGDVDGDGLEDVAIGAYLSDAHAADAGDIRFFYGVAGMNREVDDTDADAAFHPAEAGAQFGSLILPLGDFDGDGLADWLAGAPRSAASASSAGAAYVYSSRSRSDWGPDSAAEDLRVLGRAADDWLSDEGASGFDFNADGYADVALGAQQADEGVSGGGSVYLFTGP